MVNKTFCDRCEREIQKKEEIYYFKLIPITINREHTMAKEICSKCAGVMKLYYESEGAKL